MIDPKQIPDDAVEAAAEAAWDTQREHWGVYKVMLETKGHLPPFDELGESKKRELRHEARAAIAAALAAWPNGERIYRSEDEKLFTIILPLPEGDA